MVLKIVVTVNSILFTNDITSGYTFAIHCPREGRAVYLPAIFPSLLTRTLEIHRVQYLCMLLIISKIANMAIIESRHVIFVNRTNSLAIELPNLIAQQCSLTASFNGVGRFRILGGVGGGANV